MPAHRWTLYDPVTDTTVSWPLNPAEIALPALEKNVTADASTNGAPIVWQGPNKPTSIDGSNTILAREHFEFFRDWFYKETKVLIVDDLGNRIWAFLTKFKATRSLSHSHPWKAKYDITILIIEWELADAP